MSKEEKRNSIFVCGGGHQGLSMAAHLALNGCNVTLWNRTPEHIQHIINTKTIFCSGVVNGNAKIKQASSNLSEVFSDVVMVTAPSSAHKDIATEIAPYVSADSVIVLNPGRTFGAIEFAETLKKCGVRTLPHIAETQTIVYTCRRAGDDSVNIYALKQNVGIAAIKGSNIEYILSRIPKCLSKYFDKKDSVGETSLSNVGMILHCAPVLMNIGWIESDEADFKYYYDGISKSIASYLEKLDYERVNVSRAFGYNVESVLEWMKRIYSTDGNDLYNCIRNNLSYRHIDAPKTLKNRYIFEDVPNGLVPIEALGKLCGISTGNITTIIDLANSVMETDFRKKGRRYSLNILNQYL